MKITIPSQHAGKNPESFFKSTLVRGDHLFLGVNCLEPGQTQAVHSHADQDKFYFVLAGEAIFLDGAQEYPARTGDLIFAAAGEAHGVTNRSDTTLTLLVGMAPPPGSKS